MGTLFSHETSVTRRGLPSDSNSGRASVLRILTPPGDSVLGQELLPQGESSPCTGTLALGYFLRRSACPRTFPPAELLSQDISSGGVLVSI